MAASPRGLWACGAMSCGSVGSGACEDLLSPKWTAVGLRLDAQFLDLPVEAGESKAKAFGGLALVGPLPEHT